MKKYISIPLITVVPTLIIKILEYYIRYKTGFRVDEITPVNVAVDIIALICISVVFGMALDMYKYKYVVFSSPIYFAIKDIRNYIYFKELLSIGIVIGKTIIPIPFVFIAVPLSLALSLMLYKIIGSE